MGFLNNFLAGLTPNIYLQAFILLLGFIIIAEITVFVLENIFMKLAKKTKTDLDDKLLKQTKNPMSLLFIFLGIRLAVLHINVQDSLGVFLARINTVLLIISLIYIGIAVTKAMIDYWMESFAKKTKTKIDTNMVLLFKRVLNVLFFISIVLVVLKVWRIEIGPLLAGLGIGGIAVAFAMQISLFNVF